MRLTRLLSQFAVLSLLLVGIAVGMPRSSVPLGPAPHPGGPARYLREPRGSQPGA